MPPIPVPHNRETAEEVLSRFMDNAFNFKYKDNFKTAVDILHGPYFIICKDSSQRMYFKCILCNKDMNNVKGLNEHAITGSHTKNKDSEFDKLYTPKPKKSYHHSTLHYKISKCDPTIGIVGLQMIEAYDQGWGSLYYKCILCGAHGLMEPMYNHLIGNKHTDKYIRARIVLRKHVINGEEREILRRRICAKEKYTEADIKIIIGRAYYPSLWEEDGKRYKSKFKREKTDSPPPSPPSVPAPFSDAKPTQVKRELKELEEETLLRYRNPSPEVSVSATAETVPVQKVDKSLQVYSKGFLESILLKFNAIVQAHLVKETDLRSPEDLRVALNIMRYALHLFYFVFNEGEAQRMNVKKCLGFLMIELIPFFEANCGEFSTTE